MTTPSGEPPSTAEPVRTVLATRNAHKVVEVGRILAATGAAIDLVGLDDVAPELPEIAETGQDFVANALIKAHAVVDATGLPAVADDSGLAVDALGGMPGIRSARWSGTGDDEANLDLVLAQVADVEGADRSAQFVCAAVHVSPDGVETVATGVVAGRLTTARRGANGFGYDPIFVPDGDDRTTAELTPAEKDRISHRGRAFRALADQLATPAQDLVGAQDPFLPVERGGVRLRALRPDDARVVAAYRNDPEVARFQDWDLPVSEATAAAFVAEHTGVTGPEAGRWVQVGVELDGELVGDVAIGSDVTGELTMIGCTLRPERQGAGLATAAVGLLVDRLVDHAGVHRVAATLDPENVASARVLERLGFRYEGRSVGSAAVRGEWLDDDRYALLASDRESWKDRPRGTPERVVLAHLEPARLAELRQVETHRSQVRHGGTVDDALASVLVPADHAGVELSPWARVVVADDEVVGLVVLAEATATLPDPVLLHLLVDRVHQGRGIGRAAWRLAAHHLRADGQTRVVTSWTPGRGSPGGFLERMGFVPGESTSDRVHAAARLV